MNSEKTTMLNGGEDYSAYLPVIDVAEGMRRVMNSKKLYLKLLKRFDVRQMADELINSMNGTDFSAIRSNAHALKGVAANLAFTELKNTAFAIEEKAKNEAGCADMIVSLDEAAIRAVQSIEALLKEEGSYEP